MSRSWLSLLASALSLGLVLALAGAPEAAAVDERLGLLGEYSFPSGLDFQGTTVGGLSGIAYDAERNLYYVVSDDRGELQPPRFYSLEIDAELTGIADVKVVAVTTSTPMPARRAFSLTKRTARIRKILSWGRVAT